MPTTIGFLGKSGSPCIKIKISGMFPGSAQEFEGTVDTGFTGFISMPTMNALPLGLVLCGTTSVQFADGSTVTRFTALGTVEMATESKTGVIILEPSTATILVGMELLNAFEKTVFMHRGVLFIMDQAEVDKTIPPQQIDDLKAAAIAVDTLAGKVPPAS